MVCILNGYYNARPKMCFSISPTSSPAPPKVILSSDLTLDPEYSRKLPCVPFTKYYYQNYNNNTTFNKDQNIMLRQEDIKNVNSPPTDEETSSDYKQWLHAMKLVARLPGGIPPEFRRKLWLSLADKYLKAKNVDWATEKEKCFCEKWREDDEELGIQIVKDLHRTGSTLCTGPAGDLNQAKLKKILLGYARYNPEVGYCQGFNMLGALILQVMDKDESESIKVMIYLVEGILPTGYFCGSMGGLQADMAVFRELMQTKLPRLAKHLQKLQGPVENAYEPPLTNVFTMQWFLTMFCTCLPMSCVLRVWDLVLIEGSDVLLRTALALWSLLEERVLSARSADDFYGKMGSFSSELLNGHLIDSNGLIEKVVQLGPITDIQKLRDKHLYNIAPIQHEQGLQLYYDDDEPDIDEDSRLAVVTVWGIPWGRRGSQGQTNNNITKQPTENKDRIALDISLLKKQYDRLRERQKQAHIILTTACSTASRQSNTSNISASAPLPVNQLLSGRTAIVTNKGRRSGPLTGAIPPARKPSLPAVLHDKPLEKNLKRGETLNWRDTNDNRKRRDSLSWKEIKAERASLVSSGSINALKSQKIRSARLGKSDSSSYSEESDENEAGGGASSSDTSLCDEELQSQANNLKRQINCEFNQKSSSTVLLKTEKNALKQRNQSTNLKDNSKKKRPNSWAPSNSEIPFMLMTADSPNNSADENPQLDCFQIMNKKLLKAEEVSTTAKEQTIRNQSENFNWNTHLSSSTIIDLAMSKVDYSTICDSKIINISDGSLSPLTREKLSLIEANTGRTEEMGTFIDSTNSLENSEGKQDAVNDFDISSEGVTNEYFERVNSSERPTELNLLYSLNEDEFIKSEEKSHHYACDNDLSGSKNIRCMDLLVDYSEKSSVACIEEAKTEISTIQTTDTMTPITINKEYIDIAQENLLKKSRGSAEKRKDPRRLTLTRSSTMDIEKRYQALEKRLSMEICSKYKRLSTDNNNDNLSLNPTNTVDINKFTVVDSVSIPIVNEIPLSRKIPSTADLEERYNNIQRQLVKDVQEIMKSPCDSENVEKQSNMKTSENDNDMRTSFNDKKTSNTGKQPDHNESNKNTVVEETQSERSLFEIKSSPSAEIEKEDAEKFINQSQSTHDDDSKSRTSNVNLIKTKKEPPDDIKKNTDSISPDMSVVSPNKAHSEIELNKYNLDKKKKVLNENNEEHYNVGVEESIKEKHECNKTKSPPSTEELEKRFNALEEKTKPAKNESIKGYGSAEISKPEVSTTNPANNGSSSVIENDLTNSELTSQNNAKRRLSEPPSTEDLEKRYEVLKRRMSSRNFETKSFSKNGLSDKPQSTMNKKDFSLHSSTIQSPPSIENLEERFNKLHHEHNKKLSIKTQSPPSAENLEKRFEKLQNINDQIIETKNSSHTTPEARSSTAEKYLSLSNESTEVTSDGIIKNKNSLPKGNDATLKIRKRIDKFPEEKETTSTLSNNENEIKVRIIEELQTKLKEHSTNCNIENTLQQKLALIEELKLKIKPLPDESVKPTQISSSRRLHTQSLLLSSQSFKDETLESHATSANCKLEKYEPKTSANRKMVRRFSDLPSRADLENRLQFLEEQLSKKLCMQRRSGDSEVSSKCGFKHNVIGASAAESKSLEYRVQKLEDDFKEKRQHSIDAKYTNSSEKNHNEHEIEVSQIDLGTNSIALTGKELVRYPSHAEFSDIEHKNPINISINIQMTLNKDDICNKINSDVSATGDLDRRLQYLEDQLKTSLTNETSHNIPVDVQKSNEVEQETNVNVSEKAKVNKNNGNRINESDKIKDLDKKIQSDKQEICKLDKENICTDQHVENIQTECNMEEIEQEKVDLKPSIHVKTNVITHKHIENNKTEAEEVSDKLKEDTHFQKESYLSKKTNQTENNDIAGQQCEKNHKIDTVQYNTIQVANDILQSNENAFDTSKPENKDNNHVIEQLQIQDNKMCDPKERSKIQDNKINNNDDQQVQHKSQSALQSDDIFEAKTCESEEGENKEIDGKSDLKKESNIEKKNKLTNDFNVSSSTQFVPVEVNKKTLVLLLDNEPKAVKVRRLTRANTEELEDLFQALEKQLSDRGHYGIRDEKRDLAKSEKQCENQVEAKKEMSDLAKEIETFSNTETDQIEHKDKPNNTQSKQKKEDEEFNWGNDPIKYHLRKRTVYLPSTKELETRFRSLERQIKLLEDVEKIDVEQRLTEIERKIKLQYSLSHEKDLNKFLELCEGKDVNEIPPSAQKLKEEPIVQKPATKHTSSKRLKESIPVNRNLDRRNCSFDSKCSTSKQNFKKQPIHPIEMLLDPSPDDSNIPTTGELEHRIRVMEENRCTPSPPSIKSRSQSPPARKQKNNTKINTHILETLTTSPTERELPTAEELEARLEALEKEQCFDFKMQKNFQQFNQKLKDVVSPSLSCDEIKKSPKSFELDPKQADIGSSASPKMIRFREKEQSQILTLKESKESMPFADPHCCPKGSQKYATGHESLSITGLRSIRETSPLRRKGTHTGVPLRTGENINDQLTSIQKTIKSIDNLCEEKPYRKERCQKYIDALFSDSTYFTYKKSSLEDLTLRNLSRSTSREIGPFIRISDHSPSLARSMGSADSIQPSSPLRSSSPIQYRSNRDLRREPSPRRRRDEDREEQENRVRRDIQLPNSNNHINSIQCHTSHSSLTKFHKVDSQLIPKDVEHEENLRHSSFSSIDSLTYNDNTNTSNNVNTTSQRTLTTGVTISNPLNSHHFDRGISSFRQFILPSTANTPVYTPAKLEIRHTTVTSTFYDRVLTEKQLEKQQQHQHSVSKNIQSPMISPLFESKQV